MRVLEIIFYLINVSVLITMFIMRENGGRFEYFIPIVYFIRGTSSVAPLIRL